MECESEFKHSFLLKRKQLIEKHQRNRREQIFNRTRLIITESQECTQTSQHQTSSPYQSRNIQSNSIDNSTESIIKQSHSNRQKKTSSAPKRRWKYYKNFQFPQWLIHFPKSLHEYYFCLRPLAERVFLHIKKNRLLIVSMYGETLQILHLGKSTYNETLLQGYYMKESQVVMVSDLIVWKSNPMSSSQFEFRIMWLLNNFGENVIQALIKSNHPEFTVRMISYYNLNKSNLIQVYGKVKECGYDTDGIMFYHKDSFYCHEVNPDVYLWKDSITAFVIQPHQGQKLGHQLHQIQQQQVQCQKQLNTLSLEQKTINFYGELNVKTTTVSTYEEIPLCEVGQNLNQGHHHQNCIAKFTFEDIRQKSIDVKLTEENIELSQAKDEQSNFPFQFKNFRILSVHEPNTRIPDSISKIIWKFNYANNRKISIDMIFQEIQRQQTKANQMEEQS